MPLPRPILDDRSFEQLRDELVRRIPVYAPEWTDHNASDPGIALIELFAYLAESLLFRFNQIPETTSLEFLRLLHIPLRPAQPARAMLTFTCDPAPGSPGVLVPMGTEVRAGEIPFETSTEVFALPVSVLAASKARREPPDEEDEPEVFAFARRALDAIDGLQPGEEPAYYQEEFVPTTPDGSVVDFDASVDGMLWVAVLNESDRSPAELRAMLADPEKGPYLINLGFVPDREAPPASEVQPCPGELPATPAPAVTWQVSAPDADGKPAYLRLRVEGDTTDGLSREGVVRLRLPRGTGGPGTFDLDDDAAGTGDLPPRLDDEQLEALLFWIRAFRDDGSRIGKVMHVGVNAAECRQVRRARTEFLGTGTGQPDQTFTLNHRPVIDRSLVLQVEGPDGWRTWEQVDGFHASRDSDRHYVLDPEAGLVRLGDGLRGLAPQVGQRVRALEYLFGGGRRGNVPSGAISKVILPSSSDGGSVEGKNDLQALDGGDGETIAEALDRIPGELRRRDRAVTRGDFRELALQTPGGRVGRAECLPRFHPPSRNEQAAGVVTVVIWPREDARHPDAPTPDRTLLRAACRWLDARRLVTTELYVIPPTYRKVAVSVGLEIKPGYGVMAVRNWVELAIRQYLAPLPPFGPSGEGWPLGRRVHGPELEAAALQVEGVEFLEGLEVAGWDEAAGAWSAGTVTLAIDEVPVLSALTVVEGPPLPPGEGLTPPPSGVLVPIPIVREEC